MKLLLKYISHLDSFPIHAPFLVPYFILLQG